MTSLAVASLSDRRLQFWIGTSALGTTEKISLDAASEWSTISDFLAEVGPLSGAVAALAVAPLSNGALQLFASTANGGLFSTWQTTTDPDSDWTGWEDFTVEVGALPAAVTALALAPLSDGRLQLFASTANSGLFSTWKTTPNPDAAWTGWADAFDEVGALPAAVTALTLAPLSNGALQLWAATAQNHLMTTWKTTADPDADWTGWSDFLDEVIPAISSWSGSGKALVLSGGGARGSFEMGAIKCLYTRFGFRPDLIVGTSAGAINGIKLAEGRTPDEQLTAMRELESMWWSTTQRDQFFTIRPEFSLLASALTDGASGAGGRLDVSKELNIGSGAIVGVAILGPIGLIGDLLVAAELTSKVNQLLHDIQYLNSLALMDPIEKRLKDRSNLNLRRVANGTPLFVATVSLETGALRYVTGQGTFVERDGITPVASALSKSGLNNIGMTGSIADVAAAKALRKDYIKKQSQVAALKEEAADPHTDGGRRWDIRNELRDLIPKAETALHALQAAIRPHLNVRADVSLVDGVMASAAIPGIFNSRKIGTENYVDGGVREVVPIAIAVKQGADEIVAISASSNRSAEVDSFDHAGVIGCLQRALVDTTLAEVTDEDFAPPDLDGRLLTAIMPTFDVHGSTDIVPSLIEIAMHYGFMRAADVMQPGLDAHARADAFTLTDAIVRLRLDLYEEERIPTTHHIALRQLRVRMWAVRELAAERRRRGFQLPDFAELWAFEWERDFRGIRTPFGLPNPWEEYQTYYPGEAETTPAVAYGTFAPDGFTLEDRSTGAQFELVRGAVFPTSAAPLGVRLVIPQDVERFLPRIPPGRNLLMAADEPDENVQWFCDGRRRYRVSPTIVSAMGMSGEPVATVPAGGLEQIPDGGAPFWAGGLVVIDIHGNPLLDFEWGTIENIESTFDLRLLNRTGADITITSMTPVVDAAAGLAVRNFPSKVSPSTSRVATFGYRPTAAGTFPAVLEIHCDDNLIPDFKFPITLIASPEGPHGELTLDPLEVTFEGRAAQTQTQQLTLTNNGATDGYVERILIDHENEPGTFQAASQIPWRETWAITAGHSDQLIVSCTPRQRGTQTGVLTFDFRSVSTLGVGVVEPYKVSLKSIATAPRIDLQPKRPGPPPIPTGPLVVDLGTIELGDEASGSFYIGNLGDADLSVTGIEHHTIGFYGDPVTFPITIAPDDWRMVAIHAGRDWVPNDVTRPGDVLIGECSVLSDDPWVPDARFEIRVHVSGARLTRGPDFYDFGTIEAGTSTSRTMTLTNEGTSAVTIDYIKWTVGKPFTFSLPTGVTLPEALAPAATLPVTIELPVGAPSGVFVDYLTVAARDHVPPTLITGFKARVY
jgi:predicted acylesterase/phospholipase RssA